jgi:hypothetical protein
MNDDEATVDDGTVVILVAVVKSLLQQDRTTMASAETQLNPNSRRSANVARTLERLMERVALEQTGTKTNQAVESNSIMVIQTFEEEASNFSFSAVNVAEGSGICEGSGCLETPDDDDVVVDFGLRLLAPKGTSFGVPAPHAAFLWWVFSVNQGWRPTSPLPTAGGTVSPSLSIARTRSSRRTETAMPLAPSCRLPCLGLKAWMALSSSR